MKVTYTQPTEILVSPEYFIGHFIQIKANGCYKKIVGNEINYYVYV